MNVEKESQVIGVLCLGIGLISLVKPLRRVGISSRRGAALVTSAGAVLAAAAAALPAPTLRSERSGRRAEGTAAPPA